MQSTSIPFVVLFQGRAGSTYLIDCLNAHPEISAEGEILTWAYNVLRGRSQRPALRYFQAVIASSFKSRLAKSQIRRARRLYGDLSKKKVVGFKAKLRHIVDPQAMKDLLESYQIKTIIMDRRNFIKKTVAHIYGQRLFDNTKRKYGTVAWNLFDEGDRLGPQHIGPEEFDSVLRRVVSLHCSLETYATSLDAPKLYLEYRDLLLDKDRWFRTVFDFLGVAPQRLESRVLQHDPDDLRCALLNFEELKTRYSGTPFEVMFDEVVGRGVELLSSPSI